MKSFYSSIQSVAPTDRLFEIQTVINWLGLVLVWDMSCAVGDSELHHQDLPFNNAMWYLLMSTRTAYSAVITADQSWAVQPYRAFVAPTKKWGGGGGAPKGILSINLFPMSMVSMVGIVLLGDYSCCASPRSHCLLFDPLQACKNRGGRKAWEHLSHVWCQWVCTCVATKMTSSSLGHTKHPVTTFITHSCQHDTRPLHCWPPHSNELGECRTLGGKPE